MTRVQKYIYLAQNNSYLAQGCSYLAQGCSYLPQGCSYPGSPQPRGGHGALVFGKNIKHPTAPTRSAVVHRKKLVDLCQWAKTGLGESPVNYLGLLASVNRVAKRSRWTEIPGMAAVCGVMGPICFFGDLLVAPLRDKPQPGEPNRVFVWSRRLVKLLRLSCQGEVAPWEIFLSNLKNRDIAGVDHQALLVAIETLEAKGFVRHVAVDHIPIGYALTPLGKELLAFSREPRTSGDAS